VNRAVKSVRYLLLITGVALILIYNLRDNENKVDRAPTADELMEVFPGAVSLDKVDGPVPHYLGRFEQAGEQVDAACVSTTDLPPEVKGYVDQINALVVVDKSGDIRAIEIIESRETPSYLRKIFDAEFIERLVGKNVAHDDEKIDGVTGATITANALRRDAFAAARVCANQVHGLAVPAPEVVSWTAGLTDPRFIAVAAALFVALFARLSPMPRRGWREAAWIASLVLIGVYAMTPFTLVHVFQFLRLDLPGAGNLLLVMIAAFIAITTLTLGPVWCAYACPFGALQELLAMLPARKWRVTPRAMRWARELRYLTLFVAVVGAFGFGVRAFAELEPFGHLFARTGETAAWGLIACVLLMALFVRRFWCRFFCPTGACLVMLSSHRRLIKNVQCGLDQSGIDSADEDDKIPEGDQCE